MRDGPRPAADRGQSELLGFLLVFSVVVLTIALVGLTGFVGLDGAKDYQRTTNAEQAFTGLADNLDDVVGAGAPSRSTEVSIADGRLSVEPAATHIEVTDVDGNTVNETVATHPVVYDSGTGTTVTYRSGALIRRDGDSAVMYREPGFVLANDSVILPVVNTTQAGGGPVGGTSAVDVRTVHTGTDVLVRDRPVSSLTLNVTTPNAGAWARYFRAAPDELVTSIDRDGDSVEVTLTPERATVTVHHVEVTFR